MINANELMLGNWVKYRDVNYKVAYISTFDEFNFVSLIGVGLPLASEFVDFIPLTPEILEKAGFEQYMDDSIEWHIKDPFYCGEFENETFKETGGEGITSHIGCKYLHQLQNHFLLHTGQHLNIQL